jgi:putative sigma-54 modulation protein
VRLLEPPVIVNARQIDLSPALEAYVTRKVGRLVRHLEGLINPVRIELGYDDVRDADKRFFAEITLWVGDNIIRIEEAAADLRAAIDQATDLLKKEVEQLRDRIQEHRPRLKNELPTASVRTIPPEETPATEVSPADRITVVKELELKPMTVEEAVDEMALTDYQFFVFHNVETDSINVLYRRKDGSLGLIVPATG